MKNPAMRATALLISFSLIHVSVGPEVWAQWTPTANVSAPVNGGASAAAGTATRLQNNAVSAMPTVTAISANPMFLSAPAAIPALPLSAVNAAAILPAAAVPARSAASTAGKSSTDEKAASAEAPAAAPAVSDKAALETGPKTAAAGRRAAARFAELKNFFGLKSAQTVETSPVAPSDSPAVAVDKAAAYATESGLAPAVPQSMDHSGEGRAPPAATPAPQAEGKKSWFGLGATAALLLGAMLTMQVGLEAQGAAMAQLTEDAFGDFSILAQVSIFAQLGSMVGQQLAQPVIAKLGLAKTYYVAHFLRAISIGTMVFMLGSGMMPLTLMYIFYAANGMMTGIAATADGTMRKMIIGSAPGAQEKFRTIWQFSAEIIGVIAPIAFSALVVSIGPSLVTGIYPATIIMALMLLIAKKVLPSEAIAQLGEKTGFTQTVKDVVSGLARAVLHPLAAIGGILSGIKNAILAVARGLKSAVVNGARLAARAVAHPIDSLRGLKEWFKDSSMYKGFQFVWHTPALRYSFLGAATFDIMNVFLYRLFSPGYGKLIAGPAGMSPVAGMIVGLFSFGGLITAVMLLAMQRKLKAQIVKKIGWRRTVKDIAGIASKAVLHPISSIGTIGRGIMKAARSIVAVIAHPVQSLHGLKALVQQRMKAPGAKSEQVSVQNEQEVAEAQRKSVLRWMMMGVPAILLLSSFAVSLPTLGAVVALPSFLSWAGALTVPAAAMIVFGFFQVAASIKLNAFYIDSLPDPKADPANKDKVQQAIAFGGSAMTAMSIVGLLAMKPMFGHLDTFNPFPWIAVATIPVAVALFIIQRKLAAATKPAVK